MSPYYQAALGVEAVCNDRRGMHWDLDDDVRGELLLSLATIIKHALDGTEPTDPYLATLLRIARARGGSGE